jgi:hypothetical protein
VTLTEAFKELRDAVPTHAHTSIELKLESYAGEAMQTSYQVYINDHEHRYVLEEGTRLSDLVIVALAQYRRVCEV